MMESERYEGDILYPRPDIRPMAPLQGHRPKDAVWRGELPYDMVRIIHDDVLVDVGEMGDKLQAQGTPLTPEDFIDTLVSCAIMRTTERLFAELGGCTIGEGPREGS